MKMFVVGLWLLVVVVVACGGEGKVGETCGEPGKVDGECVDGAVCGQSSEPAALTCLKQCDDQSQCGTNESCNGVSGTSLKGCRPKAPPK